MKKKTKLIAGIVIAVVIVAAALFFYTKFHSKPAVKSDESKVVGMARVMMGENTANYILPGEFVPKHEASLSFQVSGKITGRYVNLGDTVKAGQVLYRMEGADYDLKLAGANAQVAAAQSELELQRINLKRAKELLAGSAIPQEQYDQQYTTYTNASDSLRNAVSNRDEMTRQVGYTDLVALKDGVIEEIFADVGTVVSGLNVPVAKIGYLGDWEAQVYLSEQQRLQFGIGSHVAISTWVKGIPDMTGTIREIAGSADPDTRMFRTRIALDNKPANLQFGMTCSVNLISGKDDKQIFIPLEALVDDNTGKPYVWVVENDVAHKRDVKVGRYGANNNIMIVSGLKPGETIITSGVITITDGAKVSKWNDESRNLGW